MAPIERPRGVYDYLPERRASLRELESELSDVVSGYGYQFAETPVIEHTELFVRKSGGERLAQIYEFEHRGRELALRPEHTASMIRMFIEQLQSQPLPVRLAYSGPVFRYEKPQAGRSRQFTEFGGELIGAEGVLADAETISIALDCLQVGGIRRPTLVLGHIGVVLGFLAGLDLDQRAQDWLIWTMERIRRGEPEAMRFPDHLVSSGSPSALGEEIDAAVGSLDREAVVSLLQQSGVHFETGSRTPEEIVQGLFDKRKRRYNPETLQSAMDFVRQLIELSGPPDDVLDSLRDLVRTRGIDTGPLNEIEQVIEVLLGSIDGDLDITIDLGMGRGLRYYTGMLFELYAGSDQRLQLCGGGRYDDLARHLGSRHPVPASGFSLGLERVLDAGDRTPESRERPRILVWPGENGPAALRLAKSLRYQGWSATVDPRERSESAARRWAQRQGFAATASGHDGDLVITSLHDNERHHHQTAPDPEMVIAK